MTAVCICVGLFFWGPSPIEVDPTPDINKVLHDAEIPEERWPQFRRLAACESGFDPEAQNGSATGLFQIHPRPWIEWAEREELVKIDDLFDPVQNARLAYAISEFHDLPRYGNRWEQWQAKPWWADCKEREKELFYTEIM